MTSKSDCGPFLSYWGHYCADTVSQLITGEDQSEFMYSEGMLTTLCYETDVGCIPRGHNLSSGVTTPKYGNSENWNKQIEGCYWCVADDSNWSGICCSKDCFFYLHDWCIERVELFTERRFCRLPCCDKSAAKGERYCNGKHRAKFDVAFAKGSDHDSLSRTVIRAGPCWYSSSGNSQFLKQPNKVKAKTNSLTIRYTQQKAINSQTYNIPSVVAYEMKFPIELRNAMIFKTDIGPIPREGIQEQHLASPYSSSPNWLREVVGCVRCGNKSMAQTGNSNFCSFRCYLLFYEWCRRLVESLTGIKLCKDTGCGKLTAEKFGCCSKKHAETLDEKYSQVKFGDFEKLIKLGANWYKKSDFPRNIAATLKAETFAEPLQETTKLRRTTFKIPQTENNSGLITNLYQLPEDYKSPFSIPEDYSEQLHTELPLNADYSSSESQSDEGSFCENNDQPHWGIPVTGLSDPIDNETNPFLPFARNANTEVVKTNITIQNPHLNEQYTFAANRLQKADDIKLHLPGDYENPFEISPTDKLEKNLGNEPHLSRKLSHIDSQASERITSTKTHHPDLTATTDTMHDSNNTGYSLRMQKSQSLTEPTPQHRSSKIHPDIYPFSLSNQLTRLLSQYTDVGVIPRHSRAPHAPVPSEYASHTNWGAEITGCYWCQLSNSSFHELTCSRRCWLLFHEWCVRKIETSCGARLCALPGCENSRPSGCMCCSLEHIKDMTELRGPAYLTIEDEVELTLGPNWYSDLSPIHFSRTGAFYEFSIYFPSLVILEGSIWPSVYHYLCAQKLVGTPYSNHISRMECVKELEIWMKRRTCAKWVRADWCDVCERDTYRAAFAKFQQNSVLRGMLLRTGRRPLVCRDSSLGDVLVGLREIFRTQRFIPTVQLGASICL